MDRDEARKAAEVMLAYADGKEIEVRKGDKWFPSDTVVFNWCDFRYRIKPQPKYRPFNSAEECWQEMQKHQPFGWMRDKTDGHYIQITTVANGKEHCTIGANFGWDFEGFFKNYTFADGSAFGVKEEGV